MASFIFASSAASDRDPLAGAAFRVMMLTGTQAIDSSTGGTMPSGRRARNLKTDAAKDLD